MQDAFSGNVDSFVINFKDIIVTMVNFVKDQILVEDYALTQNGILFPVSHNFVISNFLVVDLVNFQIFNINDPVISISK